MALTILTLVPQVLPSARAADELLLRVGSIDEMKTRNPLAPIARDADTKDVLDRVYDRPIKEWTEGLLRAFLAKGIDADEDGTFEAGEYGVWSEASPVQTPLVVTVYYDFNGARWHDGAQMTVWDLYFSYHLAAMDTWFNTDVQVLFCAVGRFYESCDRQLGIRPAAKSWDAEGAMPGDPALRAAVEFRLVEPFARFSDRTLAPLLFPAHVWSRTGGGRHEEFGCAVWIPPAEAAAKGIPECGTADAARWGQGIPSTEPVPGSTPYRHSSAAGWNPSDADVIGSGPFRFRSWTYGAGVFLNRFEDYYVGGSYDARVASYLHVPRITGIEFLRMRTMADLIYALKGGQIDVIRGNVGP
ncbi:MAG TPA: ABC transporter substrate-binding protein, partial [Thermoplasmata archaeon]|nr:ABC transporter substrate-binding protein [Thermoplasmata archaeon]